MGTKNEGMSLFIRNLDTLVVVIIFFVVTLGYFIVEPIPAVSVIRNCFGYAVAFSFVVAVLAMLQRHALYVIKKVKGQWQYSLITILSTVLMFILGAIETTRGPHYAPVFIQISATGTIALVSCIAFSIIATMFRRLRARSPVSIFVTILVILSFVFFSPLGVMYFNPVVAFGEWFSKVISGAADAGFWAACYITGIIIVVRIILAKEKFSPTG